MVVVELLNGQRFALEAGDQVTIGAVEESYRGKWFCLSKTTSASEVRMYFLGAPNEAPVKVGRSLSFTRGEVHSILDNDEVE